MEFLADAAPGITSGVVLLVVGGVLGAAGKGIVAAYRKTRAVAHEHTDLVCHLEESDEMRSELQELKGLQDAQNSALREILGDMLDREHARLVAQGYASPEEKRKFERLYMAYHGLGGNGTRTALYEDVMQMKSYPV